MVSESRYTMNFILAVTTYNRLFYLRRLIESWYETRCSSCNWQLIIADDGSDDGTTEYLNELKQKDTNFTLIENYHQGVHHQTNSILRKIEGTSFDMCFKLDDDVAFLKNGWDLAYYNIAKKTGFWHLCFYDTNWVLENNLKESIVKDDLICHCDPKNIQGAFFTITPTIIQKVGYFDIDNFGFKGLGHMDFTFRCCRYGFNDIESPFDIVNSNQYITLQDKTNYKRSTSIQFDRSINSPAEIKRKLALVQDPTRGYIPYKKGSIYESVLDPEVGEYQRLADEKFYFSDGVYSVIGTLIRRFYNFHVRNRWTYFPKLIKKIGKVFMKLGEDLYFIDR